MKIIGFDLYNEYSLAKKDGITGTLTAYLCDDGATHPALLVIPGGGYRSLAPHEGVDIAHAFCQKGFNCFELTYSLAPNAYPVQLSESVMALDLIRARADEFCIDKSKVAVIGFSAGGHLASTLATIGCDARVEKYVGKRLNTVPNAALLLYPVINLDSEIAHVGSADNVSGGDAELKAYLSTEKRVDKNTPPTFLAHAQTDETVPYQNSLVFADALAKSNVPYELHVFPDGWHGMGLGTEDDDEASRSWSTWVDMALAFLKKHNF